MTQRAWRERLDGGTPEAEQALFQRLAKDIVAIQRANQRKAGALDASRTFHARQVVGVSDATFRFRDDLPEGFRVGFAQPGASYSATVRLSNASGQRQPDHGRDLRGAALRIKLADGEQHDLLMTSYPVSHARNARQFVAFAKIASGPKRLVLPRLLLRFGASETRRMIANLKRASRVCDSLALESYWSRGAILWGHAGPVRFRLRPGSGAPAPFPVAREAFDGLFQEFAARLRAGPVSFGFCVQTFLDEKQTPIEDGASEWRDDQAPPIEIATLTLAQQDLGAPGAKAAQNRVDGTAFNPWNTTADFRPLGNLNRARQKVYAASAAGWGG